MVAVSLGFNVIPDTVMVLAVVLLKSQLSAVYGEPPVTVPVVVAPSGQLSGLPLFTPGVATVMVPAPEVPQLVLPGRPSVSVMLLAFRLEVAAFLIVTVYFITAPGMACGMQTGAPTGLVQTGWLTTVGVPLVMVSEAVFTR